MDNRERLSKTIEELLLVNSSVCGTHEPTRCRIKLYAIEYHELVGDWYRKTCDTNTRECQLSEQEVEYWDRFNSGHVVV